MMNPSANLPSELAALDSLPRASDPGSERLAQIFQVHDVLRGMLGRPLRVLDLGCGQGYIGLGLAERDALVRGIDACAGNITFCQTLAEHYHQQLSFAVGRVDETLAGLGPDQYDLVLGLGFWGPLVKELGTEAVSSLLTRAACHCGVLVVDLPWDCGVGLLTAIAFVHDIASSSTGPLSVASNRYWLLDGQAAPFDSWTEEPHQFAAGTHQGSRRYYFNPTTVVKLYRFDHNRGAYNREEFVRENELLAHPPPGFPTPTCFLCGEHGSEGWSVVERLPGRLLLDLLCEGATIDHRSLLLTILSQLVALEAVGLYHGDVRTWNILVTDQGAATLIDYGAISPLKADVAWPGDLFLSFFILVREVVTGVVDDPSPLRTIAISPHGLPPSYRCWAWELWQRPLADWSFKGMYAALLNVSKSPCAVLPSHPIESWMKATEEAMQAHKLYVKQVQYQLEMGIEQSMASSQKALALALAAMEAEAESRTALYRVEASIKEEEVDCRLPLHGALESARLAIEKNEALIAVQQQQLQTLYTGCSWQPTAPLRSLIGGLCSLTRSVTGRTRKEGRRLLTLILLHIRNHLVLIAFCRSVLRHFPRLEGHLRCFIAHRLLHSVSPPDRSIGHAAPQGLAMSPAGRRVYADLKAAREALVAERAC